MKSPQHVLVIDADIARAAGPDPQVRPWSDVAKATHDILNAVWTCRGYRVVFDLTLKREWKRHQGATRRRWFADMLSAGRVKIAKNDTTHWLKDLIRQLPRHERPTATKDRHLVALAHDPGDQRIISNDSTARDKFCRLQDHRVRKIHWVKASTESVRWILDGALNKPEWTLGHDVPSR